VERLRKDASPVGYAAADEIIRLRTEHDNLRAEQKQCEDCDPAGKAAEIERLRAALKNLEGSANTVARCYSHMPKNFAAALQSMREYADAAREALKERRNDRTAAAA
jgi:hypothetical protein